jgi:EpsI family protein
MIAGRTFMIAVLMLAATWTAAALIGQRGSPAVVQSNLEGLPMEIAGFEGTRAFFSPSIYRELNADSLLYRHYRDAEGHTISLYIGYYGTAKGGRTGHNPYACLPGAGWSLVGSQRDRLRAWYAPEGVTVNRVLASRDETIYTLLHWYQAAGTRVLATGIQQNVERFIGRVLHNRNDGAVVQVAVLTSPEQIEEAAATARKFAEEILAQLPNYWPVEE